MNEYSKLKIALEYLEAAIEERELHGRYFAAMNLAGVSEEIFGKIIRTTGGIDRLTQSVDLLHSIQDMVAKATDWEPKSKKELKKYLGTTKNGIKHMDSASDSNVKLYFEVEEESKLAIQGAIRNLDILEIYHSGTVKSFVEKYEETEPQP